jgi:hypothetical protein
MKYHPDMEILTRIADAVKKPASYFLEYRLLAAQAAFIQPDHRPRPGVATKLYRDWITTTKRSPFLKN